MALWHVTLAERVPFRSVTQLGHLRATRQPSFVEESKERRQFLLGSLRPWKPWKSAVVERLCATNFQPGELSRG